jgi:hypothetical protein
MKGIIPSMWSPQDLDHLSLVWESKPYLIDCYAGQEDIKELTSNKRRFPSFKLQREDSEGVKKNKNKNDTFSSSVEDKQYSNKFSYSS